MPGITVPGMADTDNAPISILNRDLILGAHDRVRELVAVPEWGGSVFVRSISGAERDAWELSITGSKTGNTQLNLKNLRARLIVLAACDAEFRPIFNEGDVRALGDRNAKALQRVFEVAQRLAGMTKADVEELSGNSNGESNDDSISD